MKQSEKRAKAEVALKLRQQEEQTHRFRALSLKIKNKEQMSPEEIAQFNEMTKNTKMERVLQTNEWVIDAMIREKFQDEMYYEIFISRCRDIGEPVTCKPRCNCSGESKVLQR